LEKHGEFAPFSSAADGIGQTRQVGPPPGGTAPALNSRDAIVVGSGPNGLAAAIVLVRAGCSVDVLEADHRIGGGTRSAELTLPGFIHDVCSAAHPLAMASPFFRSCPLPEYGLEFVQPPVPMAHPLDGGRAVVLGRSLEETSRGLDRDAAAYRRLVRPPWSDTSRISVGAFSSIAGWIQSTTCLPIAPCCST